MATMMARLMTLLVGLIVGAVLVGTTVLVATTVNAQDPNAPLAISQVLGYQGRLLSPNTGEPKPDSVYQITFNLYNVVTGGTALWSETKSITTSDGFFTTLLGDTTALILTNFNGQELFLGIKVGDDPEATPRQRLAHAAYAMHAETAGAADSAVNATNATNATSATNATNATNATTAGNAGLLDNLDSTAFAAASHTHAALPIAYAFINADGTKASGTSNVTSVWQGSPLNRYQITIPGQNYFYTQYVTVVTPASTAGCQTVTTSVGSVSNNLLIFVYDSTNAPIQCPFQFVTFKP